MIERRGGPRFLLEAQRRSASRVTSAGQHLEGDIALQPEIARAVDHAHPAGTEHGEDLVRTEA